MGEDKELNILSHRELGISEEEYYNKLAGKDFDEDGIIDMDSEIF